jgi:photosystem II stability/assembly factor-like uncharacterized protein
MKQLFLLITSILSLSLGTSTEVCAQWILTSPPLDGSVNVGTVSSLAVSGTNLLAASVDGAFLSTDNGATWNAVDSGINTIISTLAMSGPNFFAGTFNGFFLSTDSGKTWSDTGFNLPANFYVNAFCVSGTYSFLATDDGVYVSTNNGLSWSPANNGLPAGGWVNAFAAADADVFAGTNDSGVYLSTDNGSSWNEVSGGLTNNTIDALAFSAGNLFAGTSDSGVFLSTNLGVSWNAVNNGLTDLDILVLAGSGSNVFMGNDDGVFLSTNNGANWNAVNAGFSDTGAFSWYPGTEILSLAVSDSFVFAGQYAEVWRRPLSDFDFDAVSPIPSINNSLTNYPNPFSQSTTISFSSPESGVSEVTIVNLLGSEVARVFSGELSAGQHEFSWDASGLPPGMYECVVRMNGSVEQIPMLLK